MYSVQTFMNAMFNLHDTLCSIFLFFTAELENFQNLILEYASARTVHPRTGHEIDLQPWITTGIWKGRQRLTRMEVLGIRDPSTRKVEYGPSTN